ncbi:peptidoglycan DD-metalloendopeptidase family protein [Bacillus aerolatus]|uniref:Peptidoglycan DD-metalloendopeptidase family protein n=1 Tax=Bacillus aerolatus TaxID=2653354 RepID=A0A6I1FUL5_9BACI|nr:M23 family metallopeptidase [Bacillus aerolatus]KAB7708623.1 peptidoglycan DD-metalloendopeptidase family protein [Bacillus aerolatus]
MKEEKELFPLTEDKEELHPLFSWERFLFKWLAAAALVLATAIMFQHPSPIFEEGQGWMKKTMENEFPFSKAAEWYENTLGEPLPFTVEDWAPKEENREEAPGFALPAAGRILEDFQTNGQGILIETGPTEEVKAIKEGTVIFTGTKEGLGKTIILQHADNSESWYGHLASSSVQSYERVKAGSTLAKAEASQFYLAIKRDGVFIDPNQAVQFE